MQQCHLHYNSTFISIVKLSFICTQYFPSYRSAKNDKNREQRLFAFNSSSGISTTSTGLHHALFSQKIVIDQWPSTRLPDTKTLPNEDLVLKESEEHPLLVTDIVEVPLLRYYISDNKKYKIKIDKTK